MTTDYQTAYHILKTNAERLENNQELTIDELSDIVAQSIEAYRLCQARIEAVEQALTDKFTNLNNNDE